jgi:simple sugar transport system permease protein
MTLRRLHDAAWVSAKAPDDVRSAPRRPFWAAAARHRELPILVISVLAIVYFAATAPNFVTLTSFGTLVTYIAPTTIIAVGLTPLMIAGEIDVSVGKVFAFAPIIVVLAHTAGLPTFAAALVAVAASALIGAISGLISVVTGVSSFIITLAMYFLINGANLMLMDGIPAETPGDDVYNLIMGGGRYSEIVWALLLTALLQFILVKTRFGMHTIAVGANTLGASEVGIRVKTVKIWNFALASALAGLAGIFEAVRVTSTEPIAGGSSTTFYGIAAVVMGGTLLTGGSGTVVGAMLGAVFLGLLRDGFSLSGVSAYSFDLIVGSAIIVAMGVNSGVAKWSQRWRR